MTAFLEISRRARDKYHNLEDDTMVKNIFNLGKHKDGVGMKNPSWMLTNEMKLTDHYWMYVVVFGVDVPTTQSQPIESTQRMHRTLSAPRSPNPKTDERESSALQKSTEHLIAEEIENLVKGSENVENIEVNSSTLRQDDTQTILGTRLEPRSDKESLKVEITAELQQVRLGLVVVIIVRDDDEKPYTIKLSLAEQKSHDELKAQQNVQKVKEHLIAEEIEKLVEGAKNVEKVEESPEVEITAEVQPVNINKEEEESTEDDYELKRREKGKHVEESRSTPSPTTIRSPRIHSTLISLDTKKLQELTVNDPPPSSSTPSSSLPKLKLSATNRLLSLFKPKPRRFE
ncbi:hypothetical protein Tco_0747372 [Tanacetum coccineum]|uniref:Uncharacterized protein n=1 Tax=Tanacetum coccineum TaxID=301880 RepID=A0ABQ4YTR8_9ASTR